MDKEMININANLIEAPVKTTFMRDTEEVSVANFTLVKRYGKGKEYIHCAVYGDKVTEVMKFCSCIWVFQSESERGQNL